MNFHSTNYTIQCRPCREKDRNCYIRWYIINFSVGRYRKVDFKEFRFSQLEARHLFPVSFGGHWSPEPECRARQRIALIVPCRNRTSHLKILLGAYSSNAAEPVAGIYGVRCWTGQCWVHYTSFEFDAANAWSMLTVNAWNGRVDFDRSYSNYRVWHMPYF